MSNFAQQSITDTSPPEPHQQSPQSPGPIAASSSSRQIGGLLDSFPRGIHKSKMHVRKSNEKSPLAMSLRNMKNCYVNFAATKNASQISRSVFPYCLDEDGPSPNTPDKGKLQITNLIRKCKAQNRTIDPMGSHFIQNEEPPINEYLSYDLSKQINNGLYEVKVLAEEIKHIKKEKQKIMEDKQNYKPKNKIRIKYAGTLLNRLAQKKLRSSK